jgi:hypothetical protein
MLSNNMCSVYTILLADNMLLLVDNMMFSVYNMMLSVYNMMLSDNIVSAVAVAAEMGTPGPTAAIMAARTAELPDKAVAVAVATIQVAADVVAAEVAVAATAVAVADQEGGEDSNS